MKPFIIAQIFVAIIHTFVYGMAFYTGALLLWEISQIIIALCFSAICIILFILLEAANDRTQEEIEIIAFERYLEAL